MAMRIHNVTKWRKYDPAVGLSFNGLDGRLIEIELNTEVRARVDLVRDDATIFLGIVDGLQRLEFVTDDPWVDLVVTSEGEVWYFTNEGDYGATVHPEAVSFTKPMQRRARNPQLERMMYEMRQNEMRREALLQEQAAQFAYWRAMRERADAAKEAKEEAAAEAEAEADAE